MSDSSSFNGFRASLLAQVSRIVVNGLVLLLLTRYLLSPDEYGLFSLSVAIFGSSLLFSRLGIQKSAARYVTEYRETNPGQVRNVVRFSIAAISVTSLIVGLTLVLFRGTIVSVFGEPSMAPLLVLGFFYVSFRTFNAYFYTLFQGFNHITRSAILTISSQLGIFVGVVGLTSLGYGIMGAVAGYAIGYGFGTAVGLVFLARTLRGYETEPMEPGLRRRILEYSLPLTATGAANILFKRVDTILIGVFLTPVAVAFYELAKQISDFVIAPASALGFTVSPSYAEHKASDDSQGAARLYEIAFQHTVLFYLPAAAGLVLVAEPTIRLIFGADYTGAVPVLQVFSLFIVLQAIDKITNDGLDYLGRAKHRAIIKTSTGVLNFVLNLLLIPAIGVVGAAISTVIGYGIMVTINVYLINSELSLSVTRILRSLVLVGIITICMSTIVFALLPYITTIPTLVAVVSTGVVVWSLLAVVSGIPDVDVPIPSLPH